MVKISEKKKKTIGLIIVLLIIGGIIVSSIINHNEIKKKRDNKGVDVLELKEFNEITLADVMKKISDKESFVLYIGYTGCQACTEYKPILQRAQAELGFVAEYVNYKDINKKSKDWKNFVKKLTTNQKLTISDNGDRKTIDDSIGNILKEHGYTPVTLVFVDGLNVNGYIGQLSEDSIKTMIKATSFLEK